MTPDDAVNADYFRKGIELGLVPIEDVRTWADAAIARADVVAPAFSEVAVSKNCAQMVAALRCFNPPVDATQVAVRLFALLEVQNVDDEMALIAAVGKAMQISRQCGLDDAYNEFDGIADSIELVKQGIYSSLPHCRDEYLAAIRYWQGVI